MDCISSKNCFKFFSGIGFAAVLFIFTGLVTYAQVAPDQPQGLGITAVSSCALNLSWTQTGTLLSNAFYEIKRNTAVINNIPTPILGSVSFTDEHGAASTQYANPIVDPLVLYTYTIRAANGSDYSSPASAALRTLALPLNPQVSIPISSAGGTGFGGAIDGDNINLNWYVPPRTPTPATSTLFDQYGGFVIEESVGTYTGVGGALVWGLWRRVDRIPASFLYSGASWSRASGFTPLQRDYTYRYRFYTQEVGGFGCDYNRVQHQRLSIANPANGVVLPTRPTNLMASFNAVTKLITLQWDDTSTSTAQEDYFEVWRDAGAGWQFLKGKGVLGRSATSTTDTCPENQTCWYTVRSCRNASAGIPATCSLRADPYQVEAMLSAPTNLTATLAYVSNASKTGLVRLGWNDNSRTETGFLLERSTSGGPFQDISATCETDPINHTAGLSQSDVTECYDTVPLNDMYTYQIKAYKPGVESSYSNIVTVNAAIQMILQGQTWSAFPGSVTGIGVGWTSFNSDSIDSFGNQHSSAPNAPYSVQIDDAGVLSGAAWASADLSSGFPIGFGWLSFNQSDFLDAAGTPQCPSYSGLPCRAVFNPTNNTVTGWARFMGYKTCESDPTRCNLAQAWNGFVLVNATVSSTPTSAMAVPVAPTVSISGSASLTVGQVGTWNISISDPDGNLQFSRITWGDGTVTNRVISGGSANFALSHSYASAGSKIITVTATDNTLLTGSASQSVFVSIVSGPPAGFLKPFSEMVGGLFNGAFGGLAGVFEKAYAQAAASGFLRGTLWSNRAAGWIAASKPECKDSSVPEINCDISSSRLQLLPRVSNITVQTLPARWCDANPYIRITWNYDDGDPYNNLPQTNAEIDFYNASDDSVIYSAQTTSAQVYDLFSPLETLGVTPGSPMDFYVKVRAYSSGGQWSGWVQSITNTTPSHYPPLIDFTWSPIKFVVSSTVTFTASTTDRSAGNPIADYAWSFINAVPTTANGSQAIVSAASTTIPTALSVTDSDGVICTVQGDVMSSSTLLLHRIFRER